MAEHSVFHDEWRRCLAEHYQYVVRENDKNTEDTLILVLQRIGFTDSELRQLYLEATQHIDDLPPGFIPDRERVLPNQTQALDADRPFQPHPAECACPACMDVILEAGHDDEGQPLTEPQEPAAAEGNIFPTAEVAEAEGEAEADKPRQKSLF